LYSNKNHSVKNKQLKINRRYLMKKSIFPFGFLIALGMLMGVLEGCKEGPQGPAGQDANVVTLEGFAPDIKCGSCHNPDTDSTFHVWARKYQWEQSKHAFGGDYERAGSSCAECHTTEGFIQKTSGKAVTAAIQPSPPGCFACHSPHSRANFTLRTTSTVTLNSSVAGVADATFDYGKGNLCATCHHPRTMSPEPDPTKTAATDTLTISNNRWYAHYGVQSQLLMGTGGFQFAGYTYNGNSAHTTAPLIKSEGCIQCHMADPAASGSEFGQAGAHTMNIRYGTSSSLVEGCKNAACHPTITSPDYHSVQTQVKAYLDTLATMMKDTSIVNKFNVGAKKAWITGTDSAGYSINASSGSGALKIRPASRSGALYNFFLIEHDLSLGVHNSVYSIDLLKSSLVELRKP
jgi:mono/diheme cytochrome c family protein